MLYRVQRVDYIPPYSLRLHYTDGVQLRVNLMSWLREGLVFAPLRNPERFQNYHLERSGQVLSWGEDLEVDVDTFRCD
ncbi:DUF2442 domain-containing protein [Deinococcus roseus]|uniref:DUF2442 domain-containing protein n=1 Tax=Deinococcus roseus TaxID=392414 RepID=A0ABQ2DFF6_9DEIO|nr:DUF2442 domain-containing protein [Deinococcus roseus]GGJ53952.1 hypothetical protein GCM10008938_44970 [Deinococcus roseus]